MIGKTPSEVKSKPATFNIGDPDDLLSLAHAMREGYTLTLDGDGCAEVLKADGSAYHIADWLCDCPDSQGRDGGSYETNGRRYCKHVLWLMQIYPCQYCESTMPLTEHRTCFGEVSRTYDCPTCKNAYDFRFVRGVRRHKRLREAQQAEATRKEAAHAS